MALRSAKNMLAAVITDIYTSALTIVVAEGRG